MAIVLDGSVGISSIGTLTGVTSISSTTADTPVILHDSSSNSNTCRAWVNFNGTSTVSIRADFNVTSITDNGTGDYDVNFTTAMPDANYSAVATSNQFATRIALASVAITEFRVTTGRQADFNGNATLVDASNVNVAVFR